MVPSPEPEGASSLNLSGLACDPRELFRSGAVHQRIEDRPADRAVGAARRGRSSRARTPPARPPVSRGRLYPTGTSCFAVGYVAVGTNQTLIERYWDGKHWSIVPKPTVGVLNAISCRSINACVAVGLGDGSLVAVERHELVRLPQRRLVRSPRWCVVQQRDLLPCDRCDAHPRSCGRRAMGRLRVGDRRESRTAGRARARSRRGRVRHALVVLPGRQPPGRFRGYPANARTNGAARPGASLDGGDLTGVKGELTAGFCASSTSCLAVGDEGTARRASAR